MKAIETIQRQLLGLIGRAVVKSISAATKCQTVDVSLIAGEPKAGVEHLEPYGLPQGQTAVRKRWCCFRMATVLMRWLLRCRTGATA